MQNLTQYSGFTITANAGNVLDLTSLTFNTIQYAAGPTSNQVALFLNGSTTPYATLDYRGTAGVTFSFFPLTDADNVTQAEFRFYGWNAGDPVNGSNGMANVALYGSISTVPETATLVPILIVIACAIATSKLRKLTFLFEKQL